MIFSNEDLKTVNELLIPSMGTETLASLLHFLVRFTRAENVLEGGAGYTTPFLAMALAKNKLDFLGELNALQRKTDLYVAEIESIIGSDPQSQTVDKPKDEASFGLNKLYEQKSSVLAQRRFEWLAANPSWVRPRYYIQPYEPKLFCLDDLNDATSSASRVPSVIERVGLSNYVTFENADFWTCKPQLLFAARIPFDLIWIDLPIGVKGVVNLLQGDYWNCLRSDGGLLIIHDMMTTRGGQFLIDEFKRQQKKDRFADFEFVGLLEPQRLMQGDFILIRKTSGRRINPVDDIIQPSGRSVLEAEAEALINRMKER